jgi:hypothetical protein
VTFPPASIAIEGLKNKRGIDGIRDYSQYFRAVTGETVSRDDFLAGKPGGGKEKFRPKRKG